MTEPAWNAIPDGDDVLAFLARLEGPEHAWVTGVGAVWGAELAVARGADEESVPITGRVTLVSLSGPRTGPLMALLARTGSEGMRLFGGRLVKARSGGVSVSLDEWHPLPPLAPGGPSPAASIGQRASGGASAGAEGDDEADEVPKFGDRVDHFVFGLCDVMTVRGERLKIREVNPPNRLKEIHVGPFKVLRPVEIDGKRVFRMLKRS